MRVLGLLAEYNPFHLGHLYHLEEARRRTDPEAVVVLMTTVMTQRGDFSLLSPWDRTWMALRGGADVVLALPALWTLRDAEHYALAAVATLVGAGCTDLSFGAECDDFKRLKDTAEKLLEARTRKAVYEAMSNGMSYPRAVCHALPESKEILSSPNNILAIEYLKAVMRLGAKMNVTVIKRKSELMSASILRQTVLQDNMACASAGMPPFAYQRLKQRIDNGEYCHQAVTDGAMFCRLRTYSTEEWENVPGGHEGLPHLLQKKTMESCSMAELRSKLVSARYPASRMNRLCTHAALGITENDLEDQIAPPLLWVMGVRDDRRDLLSFLSGRNTPLLTSMAAYPHRKEKWFETERKAWELWSCSASMPGAKLFTTGVVRDGALL